jgi:hypothetical protein
MTSLVMSHIEPDLLLEHLTDRGRWSASLQQSKQVAEDNAAMAKQAYAQAVAYHWQASFLVSAVHERG